MEQTEKQPEIVRRTRDQILELIGRYDKTQGISVRKFCQQHGITEGAFYSARKRHHAASKTVYKKKGFIAIPPGPLQPSALLFAEVNGIRLYQAVPADYLKALVS